MGVFTDFWKSYKDYINFIWIPIKGRPISHRQQKTAKQNFLSCIREALPITLTLNFKIHKELH